MIRNIYIELRKNLYIPIYLISSILVAVVCLLSTGYESFNGTKYTVAEMVLFADRALLQSKEELDRYSIWYYGLSNYGTLLFPLLIGLGFMYMISTERKNGTIRFILIRSNAFRYCVSKTVSAVLSSGIILLTGYLLYGIIVFCKFPAPVDFAETYEMSESFAVFTRCLRVFGYGAYMAVIPVFVSLFFNDKYVLMCLPLIIKYILDQFSLRIMTSSLTGGEMKIASIINALSMERIVTERDGFSITNMVFYIGILAFITFIMEIIVKGHDGYGFD